MKGIVLLLSCLAAIYSNAQAGQLYRWVDSAGKVHYGDAPPADAGKVETKRFSDAASSDESLPFETRRAQQNFPVTLYVADSCVEVCNQARGLLNKRGIPFREKSLKTTDDINAFKALSGFTGVPALSVGKSYIKGFLAEQWQSELDIAGYPKTAPYRAPGKPSTSDAASSAVPANPAAQ